MSACIALCISGTYANAGELDGKRAVCAVKNNRGEDTIFFLIFAQDRVKQMQIVGREVKNSAYNFVYTEYELKEERHKVYLSPSSIFWSSFPSASKEVKSRDDVGLAVALGANGSWFHIDRHTLTAEQGFGLMGNSFAVNGGCSLADETAEAEFRTAYQSLKDSAEIDKKAKLEAAVRLKPKL